MNELEDVIKEWLQRARSDLRLAQVALGTKVERAALVLRWVEGQLAP